MPRLCHCPQFKYPKNIWWELRIVTLLIMLLPRLLLLPHTHRSKYLPKHPKHLNVLENDLHPNQTTCDIIVVYFLVFNFYVVNEREEGSSGRNSSKHFLNFICSFPDCFQTSELAPFRAFIDFTDARHKAIICLISQTIYLDARMFLSVACVCCVALE